MFQFTPLREGRRSISGYLATIVRFNSRPCVRGDQSLQGDSVLVIVRFQFTPLREGRLSKVYRKEKDNGFNSRPCVRGDALTL